MGAMTKTRFLLERRLLREQDYVCLRYSQKSKVSQELEKSLVMTHVNRCYVRFKDFTAFKASKTSRHS